MDKQQRGADVCSVNVRVFVSERLSAAEELLCDLFQREMEPLETLLETASPSVVINMIRGRGPVDHRGPLLAMDCTELTDWT